MSVFIYIYIYICIFFNLIFKSLFGKGLDSKKWIGIVADLIDIRKKVRIFCIKK
jgi:hypothetical protein